MSTLRYIVHRVTTSSTGKVWVIVNQKTPSVGMVAGSTLRTGMFQLAEKAQKPAAGKDITGKVEFVNDNPWVFPPKEDGDEPFTVYRMVGVE